MITLVFTKPEFRTPQIFSVFCWTFKKYPCFQQSYRSCSSVKNILFLPKLYFTIYEPCTLDGTFPLFYFIKSFYDNFKSKRFTPSLVSHFPSISPQEKNVHIECTYLPTYLLYSAKYSHLKHYIGRLRQHNFYNHNMIGNLDDKLSVEVYDRTIVNSISEIILPEKKKTMKIPSIQTVDPKSKICYLPIDRGRLYILLARCQLHKLSTLQHNRVILLH